MFFKFDFKGGVFNSKTQKSPKNAWQRQNILYEKKFTTCEIDFTVFLLQLIMITFCFPVQRCTGNRKRLMKTRGTFMVNESGRFQVNIEIFNLLCIPTNRYFCLPPPLNSPPENKYFTQYTVFYALYYPLKRRKKNNKAKAC